MRIAVVGVGGVGGYFGARLAQAGHELHLVARGAHLAALQDKGLRISSINGDVLVHPASVSADPATIGPVDLVLVGVKSWQLPAAAASLGPLLGPNTAVLPLLNGIDAHEILADAIGRGHVLGGLCRIVAFIEGPGHIRHSAIEPSVTFGELDGQPSPRVTAIAEALRAAGVMTEPSIDIQTEIWRKFLLIVTWSGIGALTRAPVGQWRSIAQTRALAEAALREVIAVGRAAGATLDEQLVDQTMAFLDGVQAGGTASMQRDIMAGKPSELESQNGALVRLGHKLGVATPVHAMIYAALLPQEQAAREAA